MNGILGSIAAGDFDDDGRLDLAVVGSKDDGSGAVEVLAGKGDGTFKPPVEYLAGSYPGPIVARDFNGDGRADLAVADGLLATSGGVSVLLSRLRRHFSTPRPL